MCAGAGAGLALGGPRARSGTDRLVACGALIAGADCLPLILLLLLLRQLLTRLLRWLLSLLLLWLLPWLLGLLLRLLLWLVLVLAHAIQPLLALTL